MIIYALVSDASIGYLFLAGMVPGLMMAGLQMMQVAITARRKNFPVEDPVPLREIPRITVRAFPALMMPVVLLGCIYRSEEHTSELQSLMRISYAVFCLKK